MHREADEGIRFYRQIRRITASSLHLALNRLSRVAGSADWHPTVRQQAFVSVGMRTPAEDAIDVSGTWRSLSLSGVGEMRAWTFSEGRYHSSSVQEDPGTTDEALVGSYTSGERGWGLLTPDGDSTARLHVLLDIAGGFGLAFHAVVNRDGVLQEGEGIYDGTSFWWRPDATEEERDISGSWRVFGRLLTPPEDDGTVKDDAILEAYAGSIEIDEKGTLSGRLGYWGTPPWITLSGKVSYRGGPSGALEAEIPLDLRGHTTPPIETPRIPRPSKHGHPHPPGGAAHQ